MKQFLLVFFISLSVLSCKKEGFTINGTVDGLPDGKKVTLKSIQDNMLVDFDTTSVKNGAFTFKGTVEKPDLKLLYVETIRGNLPFILGNETMNMTVYKDSISLSKIEGSPENVVVQDYFEGVMKFKEMNDSLRKQYQEARVKKDTAFMKGFFTKLQDLKEQNNAYNLDFIENHKSNLFAVVLLENLYNGRVVDDEKVSDIFNTLSPDLQASIAGQRIKEKVDAVMATKEGAVAPNFTAQNPEGKSITLNDIRGKVTIVDFWAAWCGPCRKENPNMVKLYKKYHDKGLEIIGISLDGRPRQRKAKEAWVKAIETDSLPWYQVSNLKGFRGPIAKQYNIQSIPATFVLDSDGKIVAKKLRGKDLENKIAELLD